MYMYVHVYLYISHIHSLQAVALTLHSFSSYLTSVMHSWFYLTALQKKQNCHSFIHLFIHTLHTEGLLCAKSFKVQQKLGCYLCPLRVCNLE